MGVDGNRSFRNKDVSVGVAWAQAGRDYMQDAFSLRLSSQEGGVNFFGVFDGHGPSGENVAKFVAYNLYDIVRRQYEEKPGLRFEDAIESGCLIIDELMMGGVPELMNSRGKVLGGSTGSAVWIKGEKIYNANVGDSRFIMSYRGEAVRVSKDHKPNDPIEKARILNARGWVGHDDGCYRVNGILAVSRTFGDFELKSTPGLLPDEQPVSSFPDVFIVNIDRDIDFLVVATDGVYDMKTDQEVIDYIISRMADLIPLDKICRDMIEECTMPIDSFGQGSDNMTVIIAILKR